MDTSRPPKAGKVPALIPARPVPLALSREQIERLERFIRLPEKLQEGILRYGENIRKKYSARGLDKP